MNEELKRRVKTLEGRILFITGVLDVLTAAVREDIVGYAMNRIITMFLEHKRSFRHCELNTLVFGELKWTFIDEFNEALDRLLNLGIVTTSRGWYRLNRDYKLDVDELEKLFQQINKENVAEQFAEALHNFLTKYKSLEEVVDG